MIIFFSSRPHTACLSSRPTDKPGTPSTVTNARLQTPLNEARPVSRGRIDTTAKSQSRRPDSAVSARSSVVDSLVIHEEIQPGKTKIIIFCFVFGIIW